MACSTANTAIMVAVMMTPVQGNSSPGHWAHSLSSASREAGIMWTNPVARITPAPNAFSTKKEARPLAKGRDRERARGKKTPMADAAATMKTAATRRESAAVAGSEAASAAQRAARATGSWSWAGAMVGVGSVWAKERGYVSATNERGGGGVHAPRGPLRFTTAHET